MPVEPLCFGGTLIEKHCFIYIMFSYWVLSYPHMPFADLKEIIVIFIAVVESHKYYLSYSGFMGWRWWRTNYLPWSHLNYQNHTCWCASGWHQGLCLWNLSIPCHSVHWEPPECWTAEGHGSTHAGYPWR